MYKFLSTRKIYLSKTISLPSLRYYGSFPSETDSRFAPVLPESAVKYDSIRGYGNIILFPRQSPPYEKSSYGVRTSFIRFYFSER